MSGKPVVKVDLVLGPVIFEGVREGSLIDATFLLSDCGDGAGRPRSCPLMCAAVARASPGQATSSYSDPSSVHVT
ncbi:hypothetical protein ABIB45_000932 [Arthrobacter sp. UYCo732]